MANSIPCPFRPYPKTRGYAKIFLYGDPGTLKTRRAMGDMPKPLAIMDLEGGASDYQDLAGPKDLYMATRSVTEIERGLDWIEANPGKVATLLVDPITVLWQQLQQGHIARMLRRGWYKSGNEKVTISEPEEVPFQVADWSKLKTHHAAIITRLMNLPCHVVWIARGMEKTDQNGNSKGYGWDGEKTLAFLAKIVIETRINGDVVIKDRFTNQFKDGQKVDRVDLRVFVQASGKGGVQLQREDQAADEDATGAASWGSIWPDHQTDTHDPEWEANQPGFHKALSETPYKHEDVKAFLLSINKAKPSTVGRELRRTLIAWLRQDSPFARDLRAFLASPPPSMDEPKVTEPATVHPPDDPKKSVAAWTKQQGPKDVDSPSVDPLEPVSKAANREITPAILDAWQEVRGKPTYSGMSEKDQKALIKTLLASKPALGALVAYIDTQAEIGGAG